MPDPLDIIEYAESEGKNVPNYKYGPGFTASGYYQITNPTWREWAKAAGIDISQYPTAMSAPREVQRAVAAAGLQDARLPALGGGQASSRPGEELQRWALPGSDPSGASRADRRQHPGAAEASCWSAIPSCGSPRAIAIPLPTLVSVGPRTRSTSTAAPSI